MAKSSGSRRGQSADFAHGTAHLLLGFLQLRDVLHLYLDGAVRVIPEGTDELLQRDDDLVVQAHHAQEASLPFQHANHFKTLPPIRTRLPKGVSRLNRFVATSVPMTHTGRPPSASPGEMNRPREMPVLLVKRILIGGADHVHAAGTRRLPYCMDRSVSLVTETARAMVKWSLQRLGLVDCQSAGASACACHSSWTPENQLNRLHVQDVRPDERDVFDESSVEPLDGGPMRVTVTMPITIPRVVSIERILLARMAPQEIPRPSLSSVAGSWRSAEANAGSTAMPYAVITDSR